MSHRFFASQPIAGAQARLDEEEARHLVQVLRARPGDEVTLFDGSGAEFTARVARVGKQQVELDVVARREIDRELPAAVTLGIALPKGERQRWLVEKAVELGATRLLPLETVRGVAQPTAGALARLRRAVVEASKQCGRNRLMEIAEPLGCEDYFARAPAADRRWLAHPAAAARPADAAPPQSTWLAVGPEGGFTVDEVQAAQGAGWQLRALGPRILRVETAALALLAQLAAAWEG